MAIAEVITGAVSGVIGGILSIIPKMDKQAKEHDENMLYLKSDAAKSRYHQLLGSDINYTTYIVVGAAALFLIFMVIKNPKK